MLQRPGDDRACFKVTLRGPLSLGLQLTELGLCFQVEGVEEAVRGASKDWEMGQVLQARAQTSRSAGFCIPQWPSD